jgi:hypothetical protein
VSNKCSITARTNIAIGTRAEEWATVGDITYSEMIIIL